MLSWRLNIEVVKLVLDFFDDTQHEFYRHHFSVNSFTILILHYKTKIEAFFTFLNVLCSGSQPLLGGLFFTSPSIWVLGSPNAKSKSAFSSYKLLACPHTFASKVNV